MRDGTDITVVVDWVGEGKSEAVIDMAGSVAVEGLWLCGYIMCFYRSSASC
jgi:hypothetical protein